MRDAFIKKLSEMAAANPRIMLITGDLGFGVLDDFAKRFPKQYLNCGVAEQNMAGLASGLALDGRIVYTYSIGNFPTLRCLEQLRNDACYHGANVNVVAIGGGFSYGSLGFSHHATEDISILRALPGMTVLSPGDLWETIEATQALANKSGTGYLRLDKSNASPTNKPGEVFTLGKIRTIREGTDVTLAVTGGILGVALKAADTLAAAGINARVLSIHTIKPLDADTLVKAARETGGIVSVEEHTIHGGLGGAIAETCLEAGAAPKFFYRLGLRAGFTTVVGSQDYLRAHYELDEKTLVTKVTSLVKTQK